MKPYKMCLGKISKYLTVDNIKNTELYEYVYHFSVDYDNINKRDILNIYKYLMKKYDIA